MPDGENTEQSGTPEEEPLPPGEQINAEIDLAKTQGWLTKLVGAPDVQYEAGGGGGQGQFMFADLAELDEVLGMWEQQLEEIGGDYKEINSALELIQNPAGDLMSRFQAETSRVSLEAMREHNIEMGKYTADYINKLRSSRQEMANQDTSGADYMRAVYPPPEQASSSRGGNVMPV